MVVYLRLVMDLMALYTIDSLPAILKGAAFLNPLTRFINGIRYFGISPNFYSFGVNYATLLSDLLVSLVFLVGFAILMFLFAMRAFDKTIEF
jgi:hypothetical protein